jgi:uncharacterized membrane protein
MNMNKRKKQDGLSKGKTIRQQEVEIERLEQDVERKEKEILHEEQVILRTEKQLLVKGEQIRKEAQVIYEKLHLPPLRKVTRLDINKGIIGAFFGLVSHFAFLSSGRVIDAMTLPRAFLVLALTYAVGFIMIERTGYRVIREQRYLGFIPARVTVIYLTALIVSLFVLILFDQIHSFYIPELIKTLAVTSLLAIPGAAGAHMLGRH